MNASYPARHRGITLEPLLTEAEVMDILKVSRPKIRELVRDGRLPAVVFMRHRRYLKQDVADFLEGSAPRHATGSRFMMTPRQKPTPAAPVVTRDKPR